MTRFAFPYLKLTRHYLAAAVFTAITASTSIGFAAEKINIYSHRQQVLIQPFLDAFTAKTGIETNVVYSSKGIGAAFESRRASQPCRCDFDRGYCAAFRICRSGFAGAG